jgi:hypothetical protein
MIHPNRKPGLRVALPQTGPKLNAVSWDANGSLNSGNGLMPQHTKCNSEKAAEIQRARFQPPPLQAALARIVSLLAVLPDAAIYAAVLPLVEGVHQ